MFHLLWGSIWILYANQQPCYICMAFYLKGQVKVLYSASPLQFEKLPSSYATVPTEPWWDESCSASSFIRSCKPTVKWQSWWNYISLRGTLAMYLEWDLITQQKSSVALWNQYQARPSIRGCLIYLNTPKIFATAQHYRLCTWDILQLVHISVFHLKMHCSLLNKCVFYNL